MQVLTVVGVTGLGAVVGGVAPRVAYRLAVPTGTAVRTGCHVCDAQFAAGWAGWLVLGGRCRSCGSRLGPPGWAYTVALATACAALAVRLPSRRPVDLALLITWLFMVLAGALLAGIDVQSRRLPTRLVRLTAVTVVGVLAATAVSTRHMVLLGNAVLAGGLVGLAYLLVALARPGHLGLGDVQLAAVLGLPLGATGWTVLAAGAALPYLLAIPVAIHGIVRRRRNSGRGDFAFGPYLVAGAVVGVLVAG